MTTLSSLSKLSVSRTKLHLAVRALLFMLLMVVVGGVYALTLPMNIDQVTGVWNTASARAAAIGGFPDVIPGSGWNDISCARTGTVGGETQIGWGSAAGTCPDGLDRSQSRFGFTGTSNLSTNPDEYMLLGRFTHYNNSIVAETVLGYINLNITLNFNSATGASPNPVTIPVQIQLDETPNNDSECPYGGQCSDAVFVSLPHDPIPVTIDGLPFSMLDVGFVPASETCPATPGESSPETHYVSPEGGSNSACVYAAIRFTGQSSIAVDAQPETQTVPLNSSANLTFTVTNTGNGPVQNVSVTHPLCTPAYTSGDLNSDGLLDLTESWMYSCATSPIVASSVTNVTVNASDLNGAAVAPASDSVAINIPSPTPTDRPTGVPPTQEPSDVPPAASPTPALQASATTAPVIGVFDPGMSKIGYLPEGSLGLPGEAINWDITISNYGAAAGSNVVVVDELRPELQIDGVTLEKGSFTISGQTVTITIPTLAPGEEVLVTIATTVLSRPDDLVFTNTAVMPGTDETAAASLRVRAVPQALDAPAIIMPLAASTPNPITGPIPQVDGAPTPTVEVFPGTQVCWDEDFSNGGTLPGFGPYMILILDPALTFDSAEFYHLNLVPVFTGTFPAAPGNQLNDPIADEMITGPAGHTMIVLRMPVGSVVTGGPLLQTHFCVTVDSAAAINVPLPIEVIGGYEFGDTATGVNGPILNTPDPDTGSITPILVTFDKSNSTPENERPPGPMWQYSYFLSIELAPGKTLTNASFNDTLSPYFQFTGLGPTTGTCTSTLGSSTLPSTSSPGGTLNLTFSSIVNPSASSTCTLTVEYTGYITDILDEVGNSPNDVDILNNATFDYSYLGNPGPQIPSDDHVSAEHTVFQKSASPAVVQPGDTVNYSVVFQITEYGTVASMTITDTMSAGVDYVANSGNLTVGSYNGAITPIITVNGDGTLTLVFDITALSGNIPPGSGTLTYQGTVRQHYRDGSGGSSPNPILAADPLPNTVTGDFILTDGSTFQNNSGASVVVQPISLTKEVISTPSNGIGYEPGEPVTYRLTVQIPSGDTQDVVLRDYFPLPVFDIDHPNLGLQVGIAPFTLPRYNVSGSCAGVCGIELGPMHSPGLGAVADLIAIDPATNSLEIHWPDIDTDPTAPRTLQFDITIAITDDPFADGLHLSNISRINTENTPN
ncbi:MAG: isopeptide-forming domain-containing fimbrial protein, partial [Anaerolineae bacterium]|nr:isopeptide-forming domain-containing fimbrial protein [Anaerolineae bacterium]